MGDCFCDMLTQKKRVKTIVNKIVVYVIVNVRNLWMSTNNKYIVECSNQPKKVFFAPNWIEDSDFYKLTNKMVEYVIIAKCSYWYSMVYIEKNISSSFQT